MCRKEEKMEVAQRVVELIIEKFGVTGVLPYDKSFLDNGCLKSLQIIELLFELEEEYEVEFDFNTLDISEVESPEKIQTYINLHRIRG